ncbi:MAG TPA: GMC family oxidoreductase [Deinococcales bacterium]|nr:GMC family oxidoreductase [Deinococcales bacterium]
MVTHKKVDVVTVGGGLTAAILAWKLTAAGYNVVSLERGPWRWANPDFSHNHDSLRYSVRKAMMQDLTLETWTWRPNPQATSLPIRQYGAFHPGSGVGGSMVHWSGMLWRFYPSDFKYRSHYEQKYGKGFLPANSAAQDWPVSYEELEPYYTQVEWDIGASGKAGNVNGHILPGGNPFEAPRSKPYPLPPLAVTIPSKFFAQASSNLGYHPFPQPAGILSTAYQDISGRTRSGCLYCGFCTRFGCEVDAKTSAQSTYLPLSMNTGKHEVRVGAHVTKVNTGPDGLATGVTYVDEQGNEHEQPGEIVVLSAYTLTNVRLLLLSHGGKHAQGVGNDRGQVGRNCTHQIWQDTALGLFSGHRFNLYAGNTSTLNVIHDFNADNFDHSGMGFNGGASIFSCAGERDPLTSVDGLPLNGPKWGQAWKDSLRRDWDNFVPITIQGESPAYKEHFYDLDPTYKDQYGLPLLRFTFDWTPNEQKMYRFIAQKCGQIMHAMGAGTVKVNSEIRTYDVHNYQSTHMTGGAIMGSDPSNSVCNKYGQVWDTPNVFVTGAALYPQNPGANPTGTLMALAYMTGDALRDRYFRRPNELLV